MSEVLGFGNMGCGCSARGGVRVLSTPKLCLAIIYRLPYFLYVFVMAFCCLESCYTRYASVINIRECF